jgi:pyruvate/2-oxoglutarate/acetoin dehydrogenase E1 component
MKSKYHQAIVEQMLKFAEDSKVIFLGQQVLSEDFYDTLTDIPVHCRREMPVAEEMQMGISIGMALEGYLPISIFQRMDFLPRAMDQIVNHLNLIPELSRGLFIPKVIIRTTIGTKKPLDVGLQHSGDLTELMKVACNFPVFSVKTANEVNEAYNFARDSKNSTLIIEHQELYNEI